MHINPTTSLRGQLTIPGDKSISHRSIILGSLSKGKTIISHFLMGEDCLSTIKCFSSLGITIDVEPHQVVVHGKGLYGLNAPNTSLDCGNSGTTMRLLSGVLCGQSFSSTLTGDASLLKRPMGRIITPLKQMNGQIIGTPSQSAPLHISPGTLKSISYDSPVASAQVKSAILLASLYADGETSVTEPYVSRDHTERMLNAFGQPVECSHTTCRITPTSELFGQEVIVPGDISSAAFFMVAGLITPNSELILKNVGINPTRSGILDVLIEMGGQIECFNHREVCHEPVCDMHIKTSKLHGVVVGGSMIPRLIDEIPILAVAACFAEGTTIIKDASELKVKETNRIDAVCKELGKMNANMIPTEDGMIIHPSKTLCGAHLESYHDHRMAMALSIAALNASTASYINHSQCASISYPDFFEALEKLTKH